MNDNGPDKISDRLYFNGIREDGKYHTPPMTSLELATGLDDPNHQAPEAPDENWLVKRGIEAANLAETGWGIIFPAQISNQRIAEIEEALSELIAWRKAQATQQDERYFQIFKGERGYYPGDTKRDFLERLGIDSAGIVDPSQGVPYYLLLIGTPHEIPYEFQFELGVQFAVGRLHFETLDEYAHYARNVLRTEREEEEVHKPPKASFFGVAHDRATRLSAEHLVKPLSKQLAQDFSGFLSTTDSWEIENYLAEEATRPTLNQLMGGDKTPRLLFTASHGMAFSYDHPAQLAHQGAILCQDWQGGPVDETHYLAGDHLDRQADLSGLIVFCFACYGAGTPHLNQFVNIDKQWWQKYPHRYTKPQPLIAKKSFLAGLPTAMLGHPQGALAFIGHVERAWGYSFGGRKQNIQTLESTLFGLMRGDPIGYAMEDINQRYATLATEIANEIEKISTVRNHNLNDLADYLNHRNPESLVRLWTEHNDARNYIVLGDPAVRLGITKPENSQDHFGLGTIISEPETIEEPISQTGEEESLGYPWSRSRQEEESPETEQTGIMGSLQNVSHQLAEKLNRSLEELSSMEIKTYASDHPDLEQADNETQLRAVTRISFDGNVTTLVPMQENNGNDPHLDKEIWEAHREMVELAQKHRIKFIKAVGKVTGTVIKAIKS